MRVISPIVALVTLTSGASAAINRDDKARTKKRTIFHKVKEERDGGADESSDRRARRKNRQLGNMEKVTSVKMGHIVERGIARHKKLKEKRRAEAAAAERNTDREASPSNESPADARETPAGGSVYENALETHTPAPATVPDVPGESTAADEKPAASSATSFRSPVAATFEIGAGAGEVEGWEGHTPPPATAPNVAEQMEPPEHPRRRDHLPDFVQNRRAREEFELDRMTYGQRTSRSDRDEKTGKRIRSVPEAPRPRPRRRIVAPSGKKTERDSAKPGPGRYEERDLKKSKKSSYSESKSSKGGGFHENKCVVRLTNLTKDQWFGDVFWMVHSDKLPLPLWSYGRPAFQDLAALAEDNDPTELLDFYDEFDDGVLDHDAERGPLEEGDELLFDIPVYGSYDQLTLAAPFIFSNDGFVSINGGEIDDGATWFLWGLDAGVEANVQLCWTIPAVAGDFPPNSNCDEVDDDVADENDDSFPGEGFVHVHNGIHDFNEQRRDLQDFLDFDCDDLDAQSFAEYFQNLGLDDDSLLYEDDRGNDFRDDQDFLSALEDLDDRVNPLPFLTEIALDAGDFDTFCDDLDDIEDFLIQTFESLEPQIFDFRTPMMRVIINC